MRKLGKHAPQLDHEGIRLSAHAFNHLPPVEDQPRWTMPVDRVWPMWLNDQLGDCTAAEKANLTLHFSRIAQSPILWPDTSVVALYEATSGYIPTDPATDQGAVLAKVNQHMASVGQDIGLQASEIWSGVINMDHKNLDHLCLAIDIFGAVSCGWQLTDAMYNSTDGIWDYVPASGVVGGHCAPLVNYRTVNGHRQFLTATWSMEFWVTEACIMNQCDETWLPIDRQHWVETNNTTPYGPTFDSLINYATSL